MTEIKWTKNKKMVLTIFLAVFVLAISVFLLTRADMNGIRIKTDFCDLYYPSEWKKQVGIQKESNSVLFQAEIEGYAVQPLFEIHFDSDEGDYYGMVSTKDGGEASVSLTAYLIEADASWNQEYINTLYGMQEGINHLLSKLPLVASEQVSLSEDEQEYEDIAVVTPYGNLRYPGIWEEYLRLDISEGDVCQIGFYANVGEHPKVHLFDVQIGADISGQFQMKSEDGSLYSVNIDFAAIDLDKSWSENEAHIVYGMQEGVNNIIEFLNPAEE